MGHRHFFNSSQVFDSEHDQNWNHMQAEQPYIHMARAGTSENGSFLYPVENMSVDGANFNSPWNSAPRPNGYASSSLSGDVAHYQADASGQSHDPMIHPSTAGTYPSVSDNYVHHGSSSNYDRQTFHAIEGSFVDLAMGNGRGPHKRKSPGIPGTCDRGSSSRYYNAGSSSDIAISPELQQEKPCVESQQLSWEHINRNPSYRSNNLSIRGEGSTRNVRSRSAFDLESSIARTHLSSTPPINSYSTSHPIEHSNLMDLSGQSSGTLAREWNHVSMDPAHGRIAVSDASGFSHEPNHFLVGSSSNNATLEIGGGYHPDFISGRNAVVPQNYHGTSTQSVRGVRSSYSQRSSPAFRGSSSTLRLGPVAPSDEGLQLVAENYSRHPRPLSSIGWRNNDRSGGSRVSNERHRLLSDEASLHDRLASEAFMIVERSALYGSRSMFDQHREMRLDIDNMSYEELLALGERIGSVNTGLSEDLICKSLTETIYCSSDQMQEEANCVICLEEYENMDDVGALKTCGHDFHVSCIKKWLSMKNVCPICKASALSDNLTGK